MGEVNYNGKTISDQHVRDVLVKIALKLNVDVTVTSGDRVSVVKGSSNRSHHIQKRAADFYISGHTLDEAFKIIKDKRSELFSASHRFQVIHHGLQTNTGGPHLHIGRYQSGKGFKFCEEGLTSESSGTYSCTALM